jgi:hypothetical protein
VGSGLDVSVELRGSRLGVVRVPLTEGTVEIVFPAQGRGEGGEGQGGDEMEANRLMEFWIPSMVLRALSARFSTSSSFLQSE